MKVTFIRTNLHGEASHKGIFKREFSSIEELVKFLANSKRVFLYDSKELPRRDRRILFGKYSSYKKKLMERDG